FTLLPGDRHAHQKIQSRRARPAMAAPPDARSAARSGQPDHSPARDGAGAAEARGQAGGPTMRIPIPRHLAASWEAFCRWGDVNVSPRIRRIDLLLVALGIVCVG